MKFKNLSIFFLLLLDCQTISERMHKDEIVSEAYVNNPNGLALYKTKGDLKSKEVVLNPEEKFYFLEKSNDDVKESWRRVLYGGKELFAYGAGYPHSNILEYRILEGEESRFGVIEGESILREFPFDNAKEIERVPAFSVVEILTSEFYLDGRDSVKIKIQNGKIGFTDGEFNKYNNFEVAVINAKAEVESVTGFFLITSQEPVFLDIKTMNPVSSEKYKEISYKGNLHRVNLSRKINGIRYYTYKSYNPFMGPSSYFLIPESNGKFLNEKDYTDYTIKHTRYRGNPIFIKIVRELRDENATNFLDFKVTKLTSSFKHDYFLATAGRVSFLIQKKNGNYQKYNFEEEAYFENFGIEEVKTFDLDKDGVLEILSRSKERGADYYLLLGMRDLKYQLIASFSYDSIIKDDIIYSREDISEILTLKDENGYHKSKTHPPGTKLKYQKGKLIKIK